MDDTGSVVTAGIGTSGALGCSAGCGAAPPASTEEVGGGPDAVLVTGAGADSGTLGTGFSLSAIVGDKAVLRYAAPSVSPRERV